MNNLSFLKHFEKKKINKTSDFSVGDYIKIGFYFKENDKKRIQFFEGIIISIKKSNFDKKITLRKLGNYGIERVFSCKSPNIEREKFVQSRKFNRSKLFYLRSFSGKNALKKIK